MRAISAADGPREPRPSFHPISTSVVFRLHPFLSGSQPRPLSQRSSLNYLALPLEPWASPRQALRPISAGLPVAGKPSATALLDQEHLPFHPPSTGSLMSVLPFRRLCALDGV